MVDYYISDTKRPFADYISQTRNLIKARRHAEHCTDAIIDANCPYELRPHAPIYSSNKKIKYAALLIHGLFDCPFSLRDIGKHLQDQGILSRSILLPGHGTVPTDLLNMTYQEWLQAVQYGVETLRQEAEHIFLVGYSTGAALSAHYALQNQHISGIVMLSPAIKIKAPVDVLVGWDYLLKIAAQKGMEWIHQEDENDYTKYQSIGYNPVQQVAMLTNVIRALCTEKRAALPPLFMILSREDETVSSREAINFFFRLQNPDNKLLLYSSTEHAYPDARILVKHSLYPDLRINHLSHVAIPFAGNNVHYGQYGDFVYASHIEKDEYIYGAYNLLEEKLYEKLYRLGSVKKMRRKLTYNPDFDFMAQKTVEFILSEGKAKL